MNFASYISRGSGCLSLEGSEGQSKIRYRNQQMFTTGSGDRTIEMMLAGGYRVNAVDFIRVLEIINAIGFDKMDFLFSSQFKLVFQRINTDLIDGMGQMIFRGKPGEMFSYLEHYIATRNMTQDGLAHYYRSVLDDIEAPTVNDYNPKKLLDDYGIDVPPGQTGLSPDLKSHAYTTESFTGEVKIKMSGSRGVDEMLANKLAKEISGLDPIPSGYVWHHLDDFDPLTLECTLQLISQNLHNDMIDAHIGSVRIWEKFFKVKYK